MDNLNSICPLDGRYYDKVKELSEYFSEKALIKYRIIVELKYFLFLTTIEIKQLSNIEKTKLNNLEKFCLSLSNSNDDSINDIILSVKNFEKKCNHDVKSIEYYLQSLFNKLGLDNYIPFIHIGLTSQDVTNTAYNMMVSNFINDKYYFLIEDMKEDLINISDNTINIPIISKTHGQPASPTTMGKELLVFIHRLNDIDIQNKLRTKFGGAVGNLNAHKIAFPDHNWPKLMNKFIQQLNLERYQYTTQIDPYLDLCNLFDKIKTINNICIDLCRDIWLYISYNFFKQKINQNEVGSSTMPHKVNPIDFENAEGNFMISTALLSFLSNKLPISRLQRDLTDSTVLRNIGVALGYSYLAIKSLKRGLNKLIINKEVINQDIQNNYLVVMEGIQTILRREGIQDAYEKCKSFSRNNDMPKSEDINIFINSLDISNDIKNELLNITPYNYIGYSDQ